MSGYPKVTVPADWKPTSLAPKCHTCNKAYVRPPHTECTTCYRQRTGDWKGRPS